MELTSREQLPILGRTRPMVNGLMVVPPYDDTTTIFDATCSYPGCGPGPEPVQPDDVANGSADAAVRARLATVRPKRHAAEATAITIAQLLQQPLIHRGGNVALGEPLADGGTAACFPGAPGFGEPGCKDPTAANFSADAGHDDGSCTYTITFDIDGVEWLWICVCYVEP